MKKVTHIVGIDEVGRGPLAGPVTLCAFRVEHGFDFAHLDGIKDSKQLSPQKRGEWFHRFSELRAAGRVEYACASVPAREIDGMGISRAIERAIHECLEALALPAETTQIFLDGSLKAPKRFALQETIIKGDEKVPIISAASIVAKVTRDRYMEEQARAYPQYGFDEHKGYATASHRKAIRAYGLSPLHRASFCRNIVSRAA